MRTPGLQLILAVGLGSLAVASCGQVRYPDFAVPRLSGTIVKGLPPATGRIHVDQFGYMPGEAKVAVISDPQKGYNAGDSYVPGRQLAVCRARDRKVVFRGRVQAWKGGATHEDSGDRIWCFDFTPVKTPGDYYIHDPYSNLRSPIFLVGKDVYRDVLRAAVRTFYYQRLSQALERPCADFNEPWPANSWEITENAIYYQAAYIRLLSGVMKPD